MKKHKDGITSSVICSYDVSKKDFVIYSKVIIGYIHTDMMVVPISINFLIN